MQPVTLYYRDADLGPVDGNTGQETHLRFEASAGGVDGAGTTPAEAFAALAANLDAHYNAVDEDEQAAQATAGDHDRRWR